MPDGVLCVLSLFTDITVRVGAGIKITLSRPIYSLCLCIIVLNYLCIIIPLSYIYIFLYFYFLSIFYLSLFHLSGVYLLPVSRYLLST